jgi:hypothetical protein
LIFFPGPTDTAEDDDEDEKGSEMMPDTEA